jgi:hypothetical protein
MSNNWTTSRPFALKLHMNIGLGQLMTYFEDGIKNSKVKVIMTVFVKTVTNNMTSNNLGLKLIGID